MRGMMLVLSVLSLVLGLLRAAPAVAQKCEWSALGSGMNGFVFALTVFDDGTGPALYAVGNFNRAGGVEANRIARWDGTQWSALGRGVSGPETALRGLTPVDNSTGPSRFVVEPVHGP